MASGKEAQQKFQTILCLHPPETEDDIKLFIVPAAGGLAFPQFYLAEGLSKFGGVYCFQDPALIKSRPLASSLEAMAASWVYDMQQVQPEGPYHLVGWSYGAIVAFEMAMQLKSEGEQVKLI